MTPPAIGAGTLSRLAQLSSGHPLLSVYLDGDELCDIPRVLAQLDATLDVAGPDGAAAELARACELLAGDPGIVRRARGVAIFASTAGGVLEVVKLPVSVAPMAVWDDIPWLEPLTDLITDESWGVALIGRTATRLFRGGTRSLSEFARSESPDLTRLVSLAAERIRRAHRRRRFSHLVVVAPPALHRMFQAELGDELISLQSGLIARDLTGAAPTQVAQVVAPLLEGVERSRERAALAVLDDATAADGTAAVGTDAVLVALQQRQVRLLLIAEGSSLRVGICPRCGYASTGARRCLFDGADLLATDAVQHVTRLAADQEVEMVTVRHEREAMIRRGVVAALRSPDAPGGDRAGEIDLVGTGAEELPCATPAGRDDGRDAGAVEVLV